jgi:hypothetical protein
MSIKLQKDLINAAEQNDSLSFMRELNKLTKSAINNSLLKALAHAERNYNYAKRNSDSADKAGLIKKLIKKFNRNSSFGAPRRSSTSSIFENIRQLFGFNTKYSVLVNAIRCLPDETKEKILQLIINNNPDCVNYGTRSFSSTSSMSFGSSIKTKAKKLGIRLTVTRNGKRIQKSLKTLERQINNK